MMRNVLRYGLLTFCAVLSAFPFIWMLSTSFKSLVEATTPSLSLLPEQWLWENYIETFRAAPFLQYFYNTFLTAFVVTASVVLTSLLAGYAFARLDFWGKGGLFALFIATMMIPFEVTLIPNFMLISELGWYNSYAALIVPWCANAFSIFLVRQAFLSLPKDFFDAARIDGCGHFRFLFRVGAPLVRPALVTVALFAFLGSYNSLLWPLVVTGDEDMRLIQVGLTFFANADGVRYPLLMCASTIVILPTVALYFAAQRYFLDSVLGSGVAN
ncbi:MAG: carbohydrate ABC transporter permease [Candidatus Hydrogenedentes bacterium]|nr:carbohydrate ABC transporter permease [Candidatus Hydrogenedentota bacterium]